MLNVDADLRGGTTSASDQKRASRKGPFMRRPRTNKAGALGKWAQMQSCTVMAVGTGHTCSLRASPIPLSAEAYCFSLRLDPLIEGKVGPDPGN